MVGPGFRRDERIFIVKITLLAIGRLGRTPEAGLVRDYCDRATASGRPPS